MSLTNPLYFFKSNDQVELAGDVVERVKILEEQYKQKGKGKLQIPMRLINYIDRANKIASGANAPCGERLVAKPFRMNSFLPVNVTLMSGILLSPPTIKFQLFW